MMQSPPGETRPSDFNPRVLYKRFAPALAYVVVRDSNGSEGIGSAFHVGEGVFVTARHVVDGKAIVEVGTFARSYVRLEGDDALRSAVTVHEGDETYKAHLIEPTTLAIATGPFYHTDARIDVAAFRVEKLDPYTPTVMLGDHLDDWLGTDDFVMSEVVILGFPPVPFAHGPHLVAARGEVNAQIDLRHAKHVHFLVSAIPRGGFSGGLVLTEGGLVLGLITQSLVMDGLPEQLGYMAVLSVEPIYQCLAEHRMLPRVQAEIWDGLWDQD